MMATALAPTGALFTFIALWTGALWGKPMWGTWWVWDARLTSELILLFLYLGFISLEAAIDDSRRAARASALLALVGVVNAHHLFFGTVVEYAASGGVDQFFQGAVDGGDDVDGNADHGPVVLGLYDCRGYAAGSL